MNISLVFKRAAGLLAFACPIIIQSLCAEPSSGAYEEYKGIQSTIEYLGSKQTRDLRQEGNDFSSIKVTRSGENHSDNPSLISRSQAYNPATEFFRIGLNFEAASAAKVGMTNTTPPDTNGAIGPEQYVYALNHEIRSFDRRTGQPDGVLNSQIGAFFGIIKAGDPHILYDHFSKAWYVTAMGQDPGPGGISLVFAVCQDCVITDCSVWDFYQISRDLLAPQYVGTRLDYPLMGYNADAVFMTIDVFDSSATVILGASIAVFQKETLFKGNPLVTIFPVVNINPSDSSDIPIFYSPAIDFDPHSKYAYFIHRSLSFNDGIYTTLPLLRVVNPGSSQPTLAAPVFVSVPPYSAIAPNYNPPHAGNPFPVGNGISVGAVTTCSALRHGQLYCTFGEYTNAAGQPSFTPDRVGVLWYQIDVTGDSTGCGRGVENSNTVPVAIQASMLYDNALTNPKSYIVSSISTNKLGDVVMTGSVTGATTYTNVFYAARKKSDPLDTLRNPVLVTNNTSLPFNFGPLSAVDGQRWGDYSSIFVDPCNDANFWISGMYAGVQNGWSIQATELIRTNK